MSILVVGTDVNETTTVTHPPLAALHVTDPSVNSYSLIPRLID